MAGDTTMRRVAGFCASALALTSAVGISQAAGGGSVTVGIAAITLDGVVDGAYQLLDEDTFAAPDMGETGESTSDLIGESSANLVWFDFGDANYLGYDAGAGLFVRNSGSADIHNVYVSWDDTYVYLSVEGPNAYFEGVGSGDDMDLFIAIDTLSSATSLTTPTLASSAVPGNKAVDFAGWSPNYFVAVRAIGASSHSASLYQGLNELGSDTDQATVSGDFEVVGQHASAITEIRIAWSLLGGAPSLQTGEPWNLAVYTTYSGDRYDTYDSAPGLAQASFFEEIGDCPCDSDHCAIADGGDGTMDPVTGAYDACDCVNEDDRGLGAGLSPTATESPGSDNTSGKDEDTLQGYFTISNAGQLPDGDGDGTWDGADDCPDDPNKTEPGDCGCGTPDTDGDADGTPDCDDDCPSDPSKTDPGVCGCGTPDPDCDDDCPNDPDKTEPGACGCGTPDIDSDGDGSPDCDDDCPNDPDKIDAGQCGCGTPESQCPSPSPNGNDIEKDGGCGCRVVQSRSAPQTLPWLLALVGLCGLRRRTRHAGT